MAHGSSNSTQHRGSPCCISLQNATLKDNILMGAPLEEGRYQDVLEACALRPDLELLPAGAGCLRGARAAWARGHGQQRVYRERATDLKPLGGRLQRATRTVQPAGR